MKEPLTSRHDPDAGLGCLERLLGCLTAGSGHRHIACVMSVKIQLDLPEGLAREAKATGLLETGSMTELLTAELRRRKAAAELSSVLEGIRAQPGEPLSEADIAAEIKGARRE